MTGQPYNIKKRASGLDLGMLPLFIMLTSLIGIPLACNKDVFVLADVTPSGVPVGYLISSISSQTNPVLQS